MIMTLKEVLDSLQSTSIIFAALMAAYGLDAWRREYVGKRKMELAEEVLALCLETKEIISYIRSSGGFQGEGETRQADADESDQVRRAKNQAFVPIERHNQHIEKLNRLWTLSYRFRAQFSDTEALPIEDLRNVISTIKTSCHILAVLWPLRGMAPNPTEAQKQVALCAQHEAVIWESYGSDGQSPDEIARNVQSAVSRITETCRSVLESKRTLYGWINAKIGKGTTGTE